MDIDLMFPVLPPAFDGIGDHTAHLACNLAKKGCGVRIWTASKEATPIPNVEIRSVLRTGVSTDISASVDSMSSVPPDWLVVQYNPFSYGTRGWNPYLIFSLRRLRSLAPKLRVAAIIHEPFLPPDSLRWAIMSVWQRWQFWRLGQLADALFFSTELWASTFTTWFPESNVYHLPVGSNIPIIRGNHRTEVRARYQIPEDAFVVGVFGSGHPSRLLSFIAAALKSIRQAEPSLEILYIGTAGDKVRHELSAFTVHDAGALPASDVSRHFGAMDLYLAPFRKGVSSRRGSFWAGVQHGVATISTYGIHTGPTLHRAAGRCFLLAPDDDPTAYAESALRLAIDSQSRSDIAAEGARLFSRHYTWPVLTERLLTALLNSSSVSLSSPALCQNLHNTSNKG